MAPDKLGNVFQWKVERVFKEANKEDVSTELVNHNTTPQQTNTYSLGDWYRGETLSLNINIRNVLSYDLTSVKVSVFVQNFDKDDNPVNPPDNIFNSHQPGYANILRQSGSTLDIPVRYNMVSPKAQCAQMSISFDCRTGDTRRLFKIFLRTKPFVNAIDLRVQKRTLRETLLVEAEVTNVSGLQLELDRVAFEPTKWFTVEPHRVGNSNVLAKKEKQWILFSVSMKDPKNADNQTEQKTGRVVVVWRIGRRSAKLSTDLLNRKRLSIRRIRPGPMDIDVFVTKCPREGVLHEVFDVELEIRSRDDYRIHPKLKFLTAKNHSIINVQQTAWDVGTISHGQSKFVKATFAPLAPGHHPLPNVELTCAWSGGYRAQQPKVVIRFDPQRTVYIARETKILDLTNDADEKEYNPKEAFEQKKQDPELRQVDLGPIETDESEEPATNFDEAPSDPPPADQAQEAEAEENPEAPPAQDPPQPVAPAPAALTTPEQPVVDDILSERLRTTSNPLDPNYGG